MNIVSASRQVCMSFQSPIRRRAGLTTLEFMGCLIAVVGGAWLGALYLGVDVKGAACTAIRQSPLLEKIPKEWRPDVAQDKVVTREQLVTALHEELGSLRNQITALQTGKNENAAGAAMPGGTDSTSQLPTKDRTLAYWTRLNEIALGEADLQKDAESAFNASNAAKVFAIKGRISRFAAKAVEAVPTQEVDEAALKFGRQLQLWYEGGGELYERAVRIWETPMGQQARAKLNDEWKQADLQHHNEAKLVNDKAIAVRSTIGRIYGVEFPEFAKPNPAAAGGQETSANST